LKGAYPVQARLTVSSWPAQWEGLLMVEVAATMVGEVEEGLLLAARSEASCSHRAEEAQMLVARPKANLLVAHPVV